MCHKVAPSSIYIMLLYLKEISLEKSYITHILTGTIKTKNEATTQEQVAILHRPERTSEVLELQALAVRLCAYRTRI